MLPNSGRIRLEVQQIRFPASLIVWAKGAAALSCDEEYAAERRRMRSEKPDDVLDGLGRGGKSLALGFGSAVTGIVEQPLKGAREEGIGGFFKGIGKGAIGVVTKPLGSMVDAGASTLEGYQKLNGDTEIM